MKPFVCYICQDKVIKIPCSQEPFNEKDNKYCSHYEQVKQFIESSIKKSEDKNV